MNRLLLCSLLLLVILPSISMAQNESGLHEIVIYKPGVHDRDLPKVIFDKIYHDGDDSNVIGQQVKIPPTVHVHRYYYSGDKEIQGPIIAGGPTMVVARHPKTGRQMYVDVVLPSGAPKIAYCGSSITYIFKKKRVTISFRGLPFNRNLATVDVKSGRGISRVTHESFTKNWSMLKKWHDESVVSEAVRSTSHDVKNVATNLGRGAGDVIKQGYATAKTVVGVIPGVKPLLDPSGREVERAYQDKVQVADSKARRLLPQFIKTNR